MLYFNFEAISSWIFWMCKVAEEINQLLMHIPNIEIWRFFFSFFQVCIKQYNPVFA